MRRPLADAHYGCDSTISYQQGRPLLIEEADVASAFDTAMKAECKKAGITLAEYRRHCGQNTAAR